MNITNLIEAYDTYFGDEPLDPSKLTDEQIDEIIGLETDMWKALDSLIVWKKLYANRRTIFEKKEKVATKMIARLLKRMGKQSRENEDGKAKFYVSHKFDVDLTKLSEDYLTSNWAKINWALGKGETIKGVTVTDTYWYIRVF